MRRLGVIICCALALPAASAKAWSWPVDGPVLRPFVFDSAHPYAGGQHRGIDIAGDPGTSVRAPADGIVSFAGTVPTGGKTVSIETPTGYTATLLHLGSIDVRRGASVVEGATIVGAVGASDGEQPFVYFGVRVTSQQQGYVDPLTLLPAREVSDPPAPTATSQVSEAASGAPAVGAVPAPPAVEQQSAAAPEAPVVEAPVTTATAAKGTASPAEPVTDAPSMPAVDGAAAETAPSATSALEPTASQADATPITAGMSNSAAPAPAITPSSTGLLVAHALAPAAIPSLTPLPILALQVSPAQTSVPTLVRSDVPSNSATSSAQRDETTRGKATTPVILRMRGDQATVPVHSRPSASHVLRGALIAAVSALACVALVVLLGRRRRREGSRPARIMFVPVVHSAIEEDSRRAGLALRERSATSGTCRGLRGPRGHLRALPPVEGERCPDGERNRRARYAGDGDSGQRGRLAA